MERDIHRNDARPFRHTLWSLTSGQRGRYLASMAAMALGTIFLLLVPYVLKVSLDALSRGQASLVATLAPSAAAVVVLHAMHGVFTYLRGRWSAQASEGIVRVLRHELYAHLERLPCAFFDDADTGDLVQRCSSDVETVRVFLAAQVVEIARVSLFVLVAIPIMLWQSVAMTFLCLALVPLIILFAALFFRKVKRLFRQVDESEGRLTTVLQENLTGIRVVRAFARQDFEVRKFLRRNGEFRDLEYRLFLALSSYWTLSELLVFAQLGITLFGGAYFVLQGSISLGTWVLFWWLLRTIIWPIRHIGRVLADTGKATVAMGRIQAIFNEPVEEEEEEARLTNRAVEGAIEFRDVKFAYGEGKPVIDGLSLTIQPGETIALLGPPGAGKSTLVNLLVRLYEHDSGSIYIGGRELHSICRNELRESFGMVLQDPFMYSKTVRENILIGNGSASQQDIEASTHAADIHTNIGQLEEGYETLVGERGVTLSGGQRQRLAIARALLKRPNFLVLDDSLSAVDTKTEAHILRSLAARRNRQTTILIAHRLSSTRLADRIFVIDQGELVQHGTHNELMSQDGPYRRLWDIQGSLEQEMAQDLTRTNHS